MLGALHEEMGIVCSATFRTYSVLHSFLATGVPGKRLILVHPPMEHNTSQLSHERCTDADPALPDSPENSGDTSQIHFTYHHSTDTAMGETHTHTARVSFKLYDNYS